VLSRSIVVGSGTHVVEISVTTKLNGWRPTTATPKPSRKAPGLIHVLKERASKWALPLTLSCDTNLHPGADLQNPGMVAMSIPRMALLACTVKSLRQHFGSAFAAATLTLKVEETPMTPIGIGIPVNSAVTLAIGMGSAIAGFVPSMKVTAAKVMAISTE